MFCGGRLRFEVLPSRVELEVARVIDRPEAGHPLPRPSTEHLGGGAAMTVIAVVAGS